MMNPINEMRRLSSKRYEELLRLAICNFGFCPNGNHYSKIEIITYIVAISTLRDRLSETITQNQRQNKYRIGLADGTERYVILTPEQERFLRWSIDSCINYNCAEVTSIEDTDWETP